MKNMCVLAGAVLAMSAGIANAEKLVGYAASPWAAWGTDVDEYQLDDGTGEQAIAVGAVSSIWYANQFNVAGGLDTITHVNMAFGSAGWNNGVGNVITVAVWSDPNGDGSPADAVLLSSAAHTIANWDTNIFESADVPDVNVGSNGTSFFVGYFYGLQAAGYAASRHDTDPPINGRSWVGFSTTNASNGNGLFGAGFTSGEIGGFGLPGDWLIRANAIPGPGSLALLGLGGLVAGRRRRA